MAANKGHDNNLEKEYKKKKKELNQLFREANCIIKNILFDPELDDSQRTFINSFMDNYYILKDKEANGETDYWDKEKIHLYEMVINEFNKIQMTHESINIADYPTLKIINEKQKKYNKSIEEKFASFKPKEEPQGNAGFASIIIIVGATILLGIILGALLWFLK